MIKKWMVLNSAAMLAVGGLAIPAWADSHGEAAEGHGEQHAEHHAEGHGEGHHGGNHFEGAYVTLTNEWKSASSTVNGQKISKSENAPAYAIGYNFALNDHVTLGLKFSGDTKNGEYGTGETTAGGVGETKVTEKSHYSLAFEPGYAFNNQVLAFGILAYHTAKGGLEAPTASLNGDTSINGVGYGAGFKYVLMHHVFLTGEYQHVEYDSSNIGAVAIKPKSDVFALGLGYHF